MATMDTLYTVLLPSSELENNSVNRNNNQITNEYNFHNLNATLVNNTVQGHSPLQI